MRRLLLTSVVFILSLAPNLAGAGPRSVQVEPPAPPAGFESYRGYVFDLSENAERKDVDAISDLLRRQLDVVESVGLSPKVLQFFRAVPIVASEMACLDEGAGIACYGFSLPPERASAASRTYTTWDGEKLRWSNPNFLELAADGGTGVIKLRPNMLKYAEDPVLLHEFLHAYHGKLMPQGFDNLGVRAAFADATSKQVFGKDEYALKNHQEFFAVTASIFLAGKESIHEPHTRARLKEKLPKYYKYLVELFGFDPDPSTATPVASTSNAPPQTADAATSGGT
jgi:hypothetical protein